ncbi:DUF302 domain-containing protein [candidate division KSB3 bacterium]|uniref:DUF302 domain-containing protein n=1 Tax=candidate division KSB3 bacterium TaxID=2044937 RepID=A0A9D5K0I9_9BACT|nr:DUF302 domain-containing protein [candidate division KSB3 bacterium]MBD3327410.1 DUF302 domain-containing protein [candidate division KSB3 bacterium]
MRKIFVLSCVLLFVLMSTAFAENGLVHVKSAYDVKTTADRLESILKDKGMTVFIRINHAEGAEKVGKKLRPTEVVIFGNPNVGTPFMQCQQSVAIDLPQKALIWQDEQEEVWLTYNDPQFLATRHGITKCEKVLEKIANALSNFAQAATAP